MNVLIIGSKGFIGYHLTQYLKSKEYKVYEADIVHDYGTPNYFLLDGRNENLEQLFQWDSFHVCVNCSGAAVVSNSFKEPLHDHQLNTLNVYWHLVSLKKYQPNCKYVTMSSAAVYGNPEHLPVSEDQTLKPLSPYGLHKKQAEELVQFCCDSFGLRAAILRIFSAYGPGLKKQLFWDLYQKSKESSKVSLFGTGQETRDFIFIEDLCQLIELVMNHKARGCEIYNAAMGEEISISNAVKTFYELLGFNGEYQFEKQSMAGYPSQWVANIEKANELGFSPQFSLHDGLEKYNQWLSELS